MDNKNTDRRIRKTKKFLKDGLIELMLEKSINDISVKELTEKIDLNRGTFYLHYKDIYDLLDQIEDEFLQDFNQIMFSHSKDQLDCTLISLLVDIFNYLKANSSICTVLLSNNGDRNFINKIKEVIRVKCFSVWTVMFKFPKTNAFDYFYTFIVSGCIGIFESWLNNGLKESPYEIASLTESFILNGINALEMTSTK
ncbi:TetR/AcrR family transcriptional regulator [Clostridium bornimense]|uniref:TetR/AcrR family transcriptional regulator n=1 Tax=Clostridium bornimense TaxID=1216932 RepID=UPI001C10C454|nr:TetR/AcrR family transcriptional regulator [Clostridium bornimense]MBU5315484.1 TetR/AcrR family transcriptional regulator [Clostridium bornimense]